jgi:peptidoglycan/xylan/chitin deacetylase (PgdA/CDA1 family)
MRDYWAFTVDDIGLDGYSSEKHLNNILDFCDENNIKSTLFTVPVADGVNLKNRSGYIKILKDAIGRGHEVAQHGLTHDRFEIGIPPEMIMTLPHEGPARKFLVKNRDKLPIEHTVEKIVSKLRRGQDIIENAIGTEVKGFRSPALQSCENMFKALAEAYDYDSSTYLQKAGWDLLNGMEDTPQEITMERFKSLQKSNSMKEFPLTADYTWYLRKKNFDKALELAIHDYDACMKAGIPFVSLCHVAPIQEGDDELGFELYLKLLRHIAESNEPARSLTLAEITENFKIIEE